MSVCNVGKHLNKSKICNKSSPTSSTQIKAAAQAALVPRMAALKERHALEEEEIQIKRRKGLELETEATSTLLHLSLESSLSRHRSSSKTEQLGDDGAPILFCWLWCGVSLWTGTDMGVLKCRHGHPLWSVLPKSCDYLRKNLISYFEREKRKLQPFVLWACSMGNTAKGSVIFTKQTAHTGCQTKATENAAFIKMEGWCTWSAG